VHGLQAVLRADCQGDVHEQEGIYNVGGVPPRVPLLPLLYAEKNKRLHHILSQMQDVHRKTGNDGKI